MFIPKLIALPAKKLLCELEPLSGLYQILQWNPTEFGLSSCFTVASESEK